MNKVECVNIVSKVKYITHRKDNANTFLRHVHQDNILILV